MSGFLILPSRPSFVTVLACAAVVSFIFCPHAAKAYPTIASVKSGAQPILRSFKRYSLLSSEPGILSGSTSESQSWKDPERDATSVIFPSLLLRNGHLGYNPNTPENRPHQEELSQVQRGQGLGRVKPASSIFTSLLDQQPSRVNHSPFVHSQNSEPSGFVAPNNGNSQSGYRFSWHPSIIRKSSRIQQERPLAQSASQSHDRFPKSGLTVSESGSEHKTAWQSPISFRTGGYWRSQPASEGHNSDNNNGFAGAGTSTSTGSQSSKFGVPNVPVSSSGLDTRVFKPHPSAEKLTSSITQFSQGEFPATSKNDKSNYMKVQSYLLGDSQISDKPKGVSAAPATHGFQDNVDRGREYNRQTQTNQARTRPNLFNAIYVANANGTNFNGGSVIKYHPASVIYRAPPRKDTPQKFEEASSANGNAKDAKSSQVHAVPRGPIQQRESSSPSKGHWSNLKKNSQQPIISNKEANSEARGYRFMRPSLLQKYSFGQRIASSTLSQDERTFTDYSRDLLDATSPATPKSSSFQEVPLMVHRISSTDRNLGSIYRTYKRLHGHEGYKSQPISASNFNQEGDDNDRSGGLSSVVSATHGHNGQNELNIRSKPHAKSDMLKLVTLTRVKPALLGINPEVWKMTTQSKIGQRETTISQLSGEHEQGKENVYGVLGSGQRNISIAQQPKFKAVTYHDILGSVSFSSVTPARTTTYRGNSDNTTTTMMSNEMVSHEKGTGINLVGKLDFRKAEEETQLSDMTVKETESEAKSFPHGLPSDGNLSENLSELDYLRTSTGNVSFQSLNLNL